VVQSFADKLFLFSRSNALRYMDIVVIDDLMFCQEIFGLLKSRIGLSLKAIGDMYLIRRLNSPSKYSSWPVISIMIFWAVVTFSMPPKSSISPCCASSAF